MGRLIFWVLLALAALLWWRSRGAARPDRRSRADAAAPPPSEAQPWAQTQDPEAPQAMVRCAHCGLHLPRADALVDGQQRSFCSAEHRQAAP